MNPSDKIVRYISNLEPFSRLEIEGKDMQIAYLVTSYTHTIGLCIPYLGYKVWFVFVGRCKQHAQAVRYALLGAARSTAPCIVGIDSWEAFNVIASIALYGPLGDSRTEIARLHLQRIADIVINGMQYDCFHYIKEVL